MYLERNPKGPALQGADGLGTKMRKGTACGDFSRSQGTQRVKCQREHEGVL